MSPYFEALEGLQLFRNYKGDTGAIGIEHWEAVKFITSELKKYEVGMTLGTFKKQDFVPDHALALSAAIKTTFPRVDVDRSLALRYLKRAAINEAIHLTGQYGWHLVSYEGLGLGWIKVLPKRVNNYLPKQWRIRMDVPD